MPNFFLHVFRSPWHEQQRDPRRVAHKWRQTCQKPDRLRQLVASHQGPRVSPDWKRHQEDRVPCEPLQKAMPRDLQGPGVASGAVLQRFRPEAFPEGLWRRLHPMQDRHPQGHEALYRHGRLHRPVAYEGRMGGIPAGVRWVTFHPIRVYRSVWFNSHVTLHDHSRRFRPLKWHEGVFFCISSRSRK